jgi:hypothetical protein
VNQGFGSPGVDTNSTAWSWANPSPCILSVAQIFSCLQKYCFILLDKVLKPTARFPFASPPCPARIWLAPAASRRTNPAFSTKVAAEPRGRPSREEYQLHRHELAASSESPHTRSSPQIASVQPTLNRRCIASWPHTASLQAPWNQGRTRSSPQIASLKSLPQQELNPDRELASSRSSPQQ